MVHTFVTPTSLALSIGGGTDWLAVFTANLDTLTTQNGGALSQMGTTLLSFIAMMMLIKMVVQWNTANMSFSVNPHFSSPLQGGYLVQFMLRLIFCVALETYWVTPFPGVGFGLSHLFSYAASQITQTLDQQSLTSFQQLLNDAGDKLDRPSAIQVTELICYYLVICLLGGAKGILFLINISGFILYAICALFGPLFIPLFLTNSFRGKFYQFLEVLLSLAMIRAVAAAFIFVWGGFMTVFIQQTFNGDYSIDQWMANLIPTIMIFVCFIINMLFIPSITQMIFGGGAGMVQKASDIVARWRV